VRAPPRCRPRPAKSICSDRPATTRAPCRSPPPPDWPGLPEWARTLCEFGAELANVPGTTERTVLGFSLPFRAYAAVFVALGYAAERLQVRACTDRFEPGDLLLFTRKKQSPVLIEFLGYVSGGPAATLSAERSGATFSRSPPSRARSSAPGIRYRRSVTDPPCLWWRQGGVQLNRYAGKKRLKQKGQVQISVETSSFATAMLGPDDQAWICAQALVGFVGDEERIRAELAENGFAYQGATGALGEILLPDMNVRFASHQSPISLDRLAEWSPSLIIFESANGFRKWGHLFPAAHSAVVLDRSTATWDDEYEAMRSAYSRRTRDTIGDWPVTDGTGLDTVVFGS